MKLKIITTLVLVSLLILGAINVFAQMPKKGMQKNQLVVEVNKEKSISTSGYVEKIANAFKDKLDFEIDRNNIRTYIGGNGGQKCFILRSGNLKETEFEYTASIDIKTDRILELSYYDKGKMKRNGDKYNKEYNYEQAKNTAINFIKKNKLLDINKVKYNKEFSEDFPKKFNKYYMYFKYNNNKQYLLIIIDKPTRKVQSYTLMGEINSLG